LGAAGTTPSDHLIDGGFTKNDDIEWAHESGIKLWCPPVQSKHGSDPYAPRPDANRGWRTGAGAWRPSRAKPSTSSARRPNASMPWARRMGLTRLLVRGKDKARAVLL
jgi:hypothetical protein